MKRPNARHRRRIAEQEALNVTLSYLNSPRGIPKGVTNALFTVNFAEKLLRIFGVDLGLEQIQQCRRCETFYLKERANQSACSSACSHILRQRKYRNVTGSGKSSRASTLESVTEASYQ